MGMRVGGIASYEHTSLSSNIKALQYYGARSRLFAGISLKDPKFVSCHTRGIGHNLVGGQVFMLNGWHVHSHAIIFSLRGVGIALNQSTYVVLLWALGTSHRNLSAEANWELSHDLVSSSCRFKQPIISSLKTIVQMRLLLSEVIMKTIFLCEAVTLALSTCK